MKKFIFIVITIFIVNSQSSHADEKFDCNKYLNRNFLYKQFESPIDEEYISYVKEIKDKEKERYVQYGKMLNELIVNNQIDLLLDNISQNEFYIHGAGYTSKNEVKSVRKELKQKSGDIYFYLFDIKSFYKNWEIINKRKCTINSHKGEDLDIRQYLICFKDKLRWRVYYNSKLSNYIIEFSIPDVFIERFDYFAYYVKEEKGKLTLVGF